jgi:hypothetical protein
MKKSTIGIIVTIALLTGMVVVLAILNADNARQLAARQDDATFVIRAGGEVYTVDFQTLQNAGIQNFTAYRRGGGMSAVRTSFQGVPLSVLCDFLGIDISGAESVTALAADGFSSVAAADKVRDAENVFIAAGQDGVPLATMEDGGDGPYMLVVAKDTFSQNWCKYLSELIIR